MSLAGFLNMLALARQQSIPSTKLSGSLNLGSEETLTFAASALHRGIIQVTNLENLENAHE
jgi:hypothetical protein